MHNTYNYYNETNNISQTDNSTTNVDSKALKSFKIRSLQSEPFRNKITKEGAAVVVHHYFLVSLLCFFQAPSLTKN